MNTFIQNLDLQEKGIWLPLAAGTILLIFVLLMPKRKINWRGIYLTFGVVGFITLIIDIFLMAQYLDLFDIGNPTIEGVGDLMTYAVIPPSLAVVYLNYYDRGKKWLYISLFIIISFSFEWGLTQAGYMELKGWQNWYSLPVYYIIYSLWLPWHSNLMQHTNKEPIEQSTLSDKMNEHSFNLDKPDIGRIFSLGRKKIK